MAPANPHNFSCLLQERFVPADANWTYRVDNLPKKTTANAAGLMKVISLVSNSEKQEMTLRYTSSEPNRAIDRKQLDRYLSISFEGFRLQNPLETKDAKRTSMRLRDSADYKIQLLRKGITLNDTTYRFFGHSNSQLKTGTCYLYAGKPEEISAIIEGFGSLQGIKTVAKKAKRIGLLFSAAKIATQLQPERCEDIPDVTQGDYIFTDGCGLISKHFAKLLVQRAQIRFRNQSFTPSVFQIRYRGYKGVLTLEPKLPVRTLVQFRDSMRKFRGGDDLSFAVVDYARPYAFGYLNDEVILLLNSLGVGEQVLLRKQREHLGFLQSVPHNALSAFRFLSQINETILAERVLLEGLDAVSATLQKLVNRETSKMINKRGEARSRILIPQSRLLFGICDPRDVLRNGECAIRVTMAADGVAKTIVNTEVLVTRNPCLHPGDLRKFRAVQYPQLDHLVDCIVFSNKGRRPSADLMSGGDLDGDKFLVCWDPDLIPAVLSEPAAYKGPREPVTFGPITDDHRLVYFASYTNASLGRAKNLFLDWAKVKGPMAPECQELNHLFSRCVDGNRISIPSHLLKAPEMPPNAPRFILDVLHDNATKLIKERVAPNSALAGSSFDAIELLMSRTDIAFSEFELFQMALQWCRAHERSVTELFDFFDFNQLSDDQRSWVMGRLAPTEGVPSLVLNALVSSSILEPSDLRHFNLEYQGIRWKRTYSSATDRLDLFLRNVSRAMELFERKLIVFRVDARLTLALYVPKRINMREESVVDDTCRLFAFPHSQGEETRYRRAVPTRIGYRIYYNSTGLQLYQTQKRDTWVFLTQPGANDASYVAIEDRGDKRRQRQITLDQGENADCISSIALNKFSSSLARHIGRVNRSPIQAAEVYVISNRDTRSLQVLDQWIHFVDTRETLPLFDTVASDYKLPSLKDVDWSCETKLHVDVVKHQDFTRLSSVTNVQDVLDWLFQRDEKTLLRHIYNYLLPLENGTFRPGGSFRVLGVLIDFLRRAPSLVLAFTSIATWKDLPETARFFQENALDLLIAVVSCANEMEGLVLGPFQRILSQMRFMSLSTFGKIVETIALAIELPEVALDLLSGALELESSRLLTHRPAIVRHYIKNCIGIAMEHIEEAKESQNFRKDQFELHREPGSNIVASRVRIDAQSSVPLAARDHVRLEVIGMPTNSLRATPYTMHALVEKSEPGLVSFECVHPPPAYLEHCKWRVKNCGSFVTTRTMFEALNIFIMEPEVSCGIQNQLLCLPQETDPIPHIQYPFAPRDDLNPSQNKAISTLLDCSLTCLWGPPGTGKTHTLAVALEELLSWNLDDKILVTAPTHNAVDNVLRAFLANMARRKKALPEVLRVSTEVSINSMWTEALLTI